MKVIYTNKPGREAGVCYRSSFLGVISGVKEVVIDGDFPGAAEAYERVGIKAGPASDTKQDDDVPKTREGLDSALGTLPDGNTDPDYVVHSMKGYFGDLFTDEDEAKVRELVVAPVKKPSDGLKVDELKAKLTEKGIAFDATANKPVLAKLLDEAPE